MSQRSSGTPVFETSSWEQEIVLVSEVLRRAVESFASCVFASSVWKQKVDNRQAEGGSEGMHLDDMTNPIEIRLPGCDCFVVVFCTEGLGEHTPLAFLDDIPLDLNGGATIVTLMNKSATE